MFDVILNSGDVRDFHYYVGIYSPLALTIVAIIIAYNQFALEKDREIEKRQKIFNENFYTPLLEIWDDFKKKNPNIDKELNKKHYLFKKECLDNAIELIETNKDLFDCDDRKLLKSSICNIYNVFKKLTRVSNIKNTSLKLNFFIIYQTLQVLISNAINILFIVGWPEKKQSSKHITVYYLIAKMFLATYKFIVPYWLQRFIKFRISGIATFLIFVLLFIRFFPKIFQLLLSLIKIVVRVFLKCAGLSKK